VLKKSSNSGAAPARDAHTTRTVLSLPIAVLSVMACFRQLLGLIECSGGLFVTRPSLDRSTLAKRTVERAGEIARAHRSGDATSRKPVVS